MANDNVLVSAATLTKIGDAIRAKGGTTAKIKPADMPTAIANIKIPNVRRKINIVNPSPDKQIVHVDYLTDPVSITDSAVIDTSPRIHSYVWATQGYRGGDLNIEDNHKLTEDEITVTATEATQQYQKGDKVSLDEYYKQIIGTNLTELSEVNANYLKSVYPTSMKNFLNFDEWKPFSQITIDLRELDTRYCTNLENAFYGYTSLETSHSGVVSANILGIESFNVSNVTNFKSTLEPEAYYKSDKNLDLSKWDVRNGISFKNFIGGLDTLDISSFGENTKLNTGVISLGVRVINNLIIDGKYVSLSKKFTGDILNLYAPHNLLDDYKIANGGFVTNYKPCEKLIKATIPAGYVISFNDSIIPEQDGIAYIPYKTTKATYCMINPNYLPVTGEIDVSSMARSEEKDIILEDTAKDTSGYTLTVNTTPSNATVKLTYKGVTLTGNKIMVPANTEVNVEITCADYKTIRKTVAVTQKSQIDNNSMVVVDPTDHANFANNYTFSKVESTLLDNDNFAIDTDKKCLYSKKAYYVNNGISTGYIHIPANTFNEDRTLKASVRTNAERTYDTGIILVGNSNYTVVSTYNHDISEGSTVTLNSKTYTLLYNSYGKNETAFRTVSTTLKANTEYYIIFAYTKDNSGNNNEDKMFIQSIDIE